MFLQWALTMNFLKHFISSFSQGCDLCWYFLNMKHSMRQGYDGCIGSGAGAGLKIKSFMLAVIHQELQLTNILHKRTITEPSSFPIIQSCGNVFSFQPPSPKQLGNKFVFKIVYRSRHNAATSVCHDFHISSLCWSIKNTWLGRCSCRKQISSQIFLILYISESW